MTSFPDPQPIFRKISKQLVTYKRADGVPPELRALPAARLQTRYASTDPDLGPTRGEFNDADTAGQGFPASSKRFTEVTGYSQLFHVLDGFAVLG